MLARGEGELELLEAEDRRRHAAELASWQAAAAAQTAVQGQQASCHRCCRHAPSS
jgi:hypothetical protein